MANHSTYFSLVGILTGIPIGTAKPPGKYVYQKTKKGLGNIEGDRSGRQQVRAWTKGTLRHTIKQQPNRLRFAVGVEAWHGMTQPEKDAWTSPSNQKKLNRFQGFMRDWNRTRPVPVPTGWDAGATSWDAGQTNFDMASPTFWDLSATTWDGSLTTFDTPKATAFDGDKTSWDNGGTYFFN